MNDRLWNEMLTEFRALGGTADNICLREGPFARGVFPIDPSRPVRIHIPEHMLAAVADCTLADGRFQVRGDSGLGARQTAFLEDYENRLSWGGGGRAEVERILAQAQELPAELRHDLKLRHDCGNWFADPSDALLRERFIETRCVSYQGRSVVMPFIELLNHGPDGLPYQIKDGILLAGRFEGEVLARYSSSDPLGIFANWGFLSDQPQAFSVALTNRRDGGDLRISRELMGLSPFEKFWVPKISAGDGFTFRFLMIGNRAYPRRCRGIFYRLMREAGAKDIEEAFDVVYHANLTRVESLLAAVEKQRGAMADTLRKLARLQLKTISYCFGAVE